MNAARSSVALLILLLLALQSTGRAEPKDTATTTKLKEAIAKELVHVADKASDNDLNARAESLLKEALALVPDDRKASRALKRLDNRTDTGDAEAVGAFEKKSDRYRKKAATFYCELFSELFSDKDKGAVDAYLKRAFELHRETADDWVEGEYKKLLGQKQYGETQRVLDIAQAFPSDDKKRAEARQAAMIECEAQVSCKKPILKSCRTHDIKYYLSLPTGWTADKKWPVYVAVEGAGCNFYGACNGAKGKGNDTFIVVTPIGFTNTNGLTEGIRKKYPYDKELIDEADKNRMGFDEPGLLAIIKDLQELYSAEEKVCITGFSGGGILTWHMIFTHPEKLLAAVPSCANFGGVREISEDAEAKKALIIHAFQGEKDKYKESMLDAQWERALKTAKDNGYEHITRDLVPGVGHNPCHAQARKVFLEALGKGDK